jgi:hypothetical protein
VSKDVQTYLLGWDKALFYTEIDTFDLSDINPESVRIDGSGDGDLEGKIVVFDATDGQKAIACQMKGDHCLTPEYDSEQLRFSTREYAKRFTKAFMARRGFVRW